MKLSLVILHMVAAGAFAQNWVPVGFLAPGSAHTAVRLAFATNRAQGQPTSRGTVFSPKREPTEKIHYGFCTVTIPFSHELGKLESPRWPFQEDVTKHFILHRVDSAKSRSQFFTETDTRLRSLRSAEREILVFVHGFNTSFKDAALRTAQLAYDLGFRGMPMMFSWPPPKA